MVIPPLSGELNLLPQDTTIATVLSAAGYRTCLVNKWHLDGYDKGASLIIMDLTNFMDGLSLRYTVTLLIIIPIIVSTVTHSSTSQKMQMENMVFITTT